MCLPTIHGDDQVYLRTSTPSLQNWSFEPERVITMATPESEMSKSAPASSQRPRRAIQRPAYLYDYMVDYAGNPSGQTVKSKQKVMVTSTPISSHYPFGTASASEDFMLQIMEITRQQSETARRQTELLEKVL